MICAGMLVAISCDPIVLVDLEPSFDQPVLAGESLLMWRAAGGPPSVEAASRCGSATGQTDPPRSPMS